MHFAHVREAKNGNLYLAITESQVNGDSKRKSTIRVFGEAIGQLSETVAGSGGLRKYRTRYTMPRVYLCGAFSFITIIMEKKLCHTILMLRTTNLR